MKFIPAYLVAVLWAALVFSACCGCFAQSTPLQGSAIQGQVKDPSGAVVPNAVVMVSSPHTKSETAATTSSGTYIVRGLAAGTYSVTVTASGFAPFVKNAIAVSLNTMKQLDVSLSIEVVPQQVQVDSDSSRVGTNPENNANALVIKGKDLDALSDDPDELLNDLHALAGPAAGPSGGEVYIDGFSGGQLPPKSSIREIRVNQNPFSAQYDRLGYGRIEIFTKPGTDKLHGEIGSRGNDSAFNSKNPLLSQAPPGYFSYDLKGSLSGPLSKNASYSFNIFARNHQNTSVVSATDPASITASNPNGTAFSQALSNPNSGLDLSQRVDLQLGQANTLSFRYNFSRAVNTNQGVGQIDLPLQAYNTHSLANEFQISDSVILSKSIVDSLRFQFRRIQTQQTARDSSPTVTVQGAFADGGSNAGNTQDSQNDFEFQDYLTAVACNHGLNFGGRARVYRDTNFSDAGTNGAYTFQSALNYLNKTPQTYAVTVVNNPYARISLFDAALFYQDDWKIDPRFTFSYGLRWETQTRIHDKSDWVPRLSLAWALGWSKGKPAKTVLRAGYGWFFQRFTVPGSFAATSGTPYLTTVIRENGVNQVGLTVSSPSGYQETSPGVAIKPPDPMASGSAQTQYSVAKDFHAADDMQAETGLDRQLAKGVTANLTYLYSRGIHQYLTNNLGAATFPTAAQGIYPRQPLAAPSANLMQYQSGGVYRQSQVIATVSAHYLRYSAFGFYTYNNAKGDTIGVTAVPFIAQDPGLDYGRTNFDIHHRVVVAGSFLAPFGISLSPMFLYNSGTPYNITIGSDLTANNQFNARPTFATLASCELSSTQYVASPYGCLDANPIGTDERIVPYGLGTGPANIALNLHLSKTIGIGPRVEAGAGAGPTGPPPPGSPPGGLGAGGLSSTHDGPRDMRTATIRRYSLTFDVMAHNLLNYQNLGTPNGTLNSPPALRFKSQSLAGGPFSPPEGGNRSIFLEVHFNF
jgi:hypothetical protein